jgi:hypothetical protein
MVTPYLRRRLERPSGTPTYGYREVLVHLHVVKCPAADPVGHAFAHVMLGEDDVMDADAAQDLSSCQPDRAEG